MITQRQLQVLRLFAQGYSQIEIAYELGISLRTVEEHIMGSKDRLGAKNSVNAVAIAISRGIIELLILISLYQAVFDVYPCDMRRPPRVRTRIVRVVRVNRTKES